MAQSNERVSELLRNLGNSSPWLVKPELIEITSATVSLSAARSAAGRELHDAHRPQAADRRPETTPPVRPRPPRRRGKRAIGKGKRHGARRFDLALALRRFSQQFQGSNPNDPSVWPAVPRYALCRRRSRSVLVALWFVWLTNSNDELEAERAKEVTLRADYQKKVAQAANLDLLKKQREQVQQYVTLLEKQLPSKAEMDALLSDINQAGLGRSLQFELFRPGQVSVRDYYAELPIAVRVTGQLPRHGCLRRRRRQPVAHRDPEQPVGARRRRMAR